MTHDCFACLGRHRAHASALLQGQDAAVVNITSRIGIPIGEGFAPCTHCRIEHCGA
jgi:hypothetical protein